MCYLDNSHFIIPIPLKFEIWNCNLKSKNENLESGTTWILVVGTQHCLQILVFTRPKVYLILTF